MRRRVIALALAALLAFPIASLADDAAEDPADDAASVAPAEVPDAAKEDPEGDEEEAEPEEEASAEEEEDEAEPTAWDEYLASVGERFLTGLNGVVTAPADPPMAAVEPPKALDKAGYVRHPLGFASGILLMGYRTFTGAVDFTLAPFPKLPVLSPVPRYQLIPGFEHEDS
jgi:hypothetical protein